jgi:transposase InsO family protein
VGLVGGEVDGQLFGGEVWEVDLAVFGVGAGREGPDDLAEVGDVDVVLDITSRLVRPRPHTLHRTEPEYVHVCIDDATRLAYVEVLSDEKATTAIGFLHRAVKHFASYGITVERLITDNGSAYRSTVHAIACHALSIRHLRTRPYRPQTNGKAERFIRTMLSGWAYGAIYRDSNERNAALAGWLDFYNRRRPHGALSHKPPIARLHELNNLLGSYT